MNPDDFPAPKVGFVVPNVLVVSDQDRSREFYRALFDGQVLLERDPVIMKVANPGPILNVGGGPTDDKPTVTLTTPPDPNRTSAFLNIRVADIHQVYKEWSAKGAEFLTEPKDHGQEIRAYIRDPDGHLIEVGQSTRALSRRGSTLARDEVAREAELAAVERRVTDAVDDRVAATHLPSSPSPSLT